MSRKAIALAVALLALVAWCAEAPGQTIDTLRIRTPSTITTDGGSTVRVPPGFFVPDPVWQEIDDEWRRLQDAETRLRAENESYLKTIEDHRWKLVIGVVAGVVVGWGLAHAEI